MGVLTFHRCINYGSYWQARSLVEGLRSLGYEPEILDHRSAEVDRKEWRVALRPLPEDKAPTDPFRRKIGRFQDAWKDLPLSDPFDLHCPEIGPYDAIVVGSDEVWNLAHPWYGQIPLFYGDGLRQPSGNLISYAASFGNFSAQWGLHPWWAGKLTHFDHISVRDHNSRKLIRQALAIDPPIVLDPCLQWPLTPRASTLEPSRFIVLYGHEFSDTFIAQIRRVAKNRKLKTTSIGYQNHWADENCIDAGPYEFAEFLNRADLVVTNFFHGCVFALRSAKPLICETMPYREIKVRDLLAMLGASKHRITEGTTEDTIDRLAEEPTFEYLDTIECLRQRSEEVLTRALG